LTVINNRTVYKSLWFINNNKVTAVGSQNKVGLYLDFLVGVEGGSAD
jgi:hypothetical protein